MKTLLLIIPLITIISCSRNDNNTDMQRDKIVFNQPARDIKDSMRIMNKLLDRMPTANAVYVFSNQEEDILRINGRQIGRIGDLLTNEETDSISDFKNINKGDIRRFLNLIIFFKNNDLTSTFFHPTLKIYMYEYKEFERSGPLTHDEDKVRHIAFFDNTDIFVNPEFWKYYSIYDVKDSLVMFGERTDAWRFLELTK